MSAVVVAIGLALGLGACAGGTGGYYQLNSQQLAANGWVSQTASICTATQAAEQKLPFVPVSTIKRDSGAAEKEARAEDGTAALIRVQIQKLRKLSESSSVAVNATQRRAFKEYLMALSAEAALEKQDAASLRAGKSPTAQRPRTKTVRLVDKMAPYANRANLPENCGATKNPRQYQIGKGRARYIR